MTSAMSLPNQLELHTHDAYSSGPMSMPVNGTADVPSIPVVRSDSSPEPPSKHVNTFGAFLELYNSPADLIKAYEDHRQRRNLERRSLILSSGIICPDKILRGLVLENQPPEFDPRNCISLWCRPPSHVMQFIAQVQSKLRQAEPEIWCMPQNCLHMTALEIVHSKPDSYVNSVVAQLQPHLDHLLAPLPAPLLVKPILSYDQNALAISFVPEEHGISQSEWYTYQHYRRDLCDIVQRKAGVTVDSRYHFPSAHVTIARFVKPLSGPVEKWIDALDAINEWIASSGTTKNIRWVVGEERGSECRCGLIWYGGGRAEGIGMTVQEATHRERKGSKERHVWRVR